MNNETKNILLFGAGKSATVLIEYLLKKSEQENWMLTIIDANLKLAKAKTQYHPRATVRSFDVKNDIERSTTISNASIVISMLPPALHYLVAKDCIIYKKNLLTASYLDDSIRSLESDIKKEGLLFLCEMGLDPGIDHMSAMQLITRIKNDGGHLKSFISHCGGLVAPESDDNPWHYKISWNPANVVKAGKDGAIYKENNNIIHRSYVDIFKYCKTVNIPSLGELAYYPNRDSLEYIKLYGLENVETFIRTTLRHPAFCKGWQYIIEAKLTDTAPQMMHFNDTSFKDWFLSHLLSYSHIGSFDDYLNTIVLPSDRNTIKKQFDYLGLLSEDFVPNTVYTSADILQYLLESKLRLNTTDRDMVVMLHEINYEYNNAAQNLKTTLIIKGDNNTHTAMAKTVGLPLAIAAELLLNNAITIKGLHIPIIPEIYAPILAQLEENGIKFIEM